MTVMSLWFTRKDRRAMYVPKNVVSKQSLRGVIRLDWRRWSEGDRRNHNSAYPSKAARFTKDQKP